MNDAKDRFINWYSGLSDKEREKIMERVSDMDSMKSQSNFERNRENYIKQKAANELRGVEMKKKVKAGMFVQCDGTKDGTGFREVMKTDIYGITGQKLSKRFRFENGIIKQKDGTYNKVRIVYWIRENYITTHGWDKVKKIIDVSKMEIR